MTSAALFHELFDDASMFPPGNAPLTLAVAQHLRHRVAPYAAFLGPFVSRHASLGAVSESSAIPITAAVIVSSAQNLRPIIRATSQLRHIELVALEIRIAQLSEVADVARAVRAAGLPTFVELPVAQITEKAVRMLAAAGLFLKIRTGGMDECAFPAEAHLAPAITRCVEAGLPFKCTAGLHRAVRHRDHDTGFEHHGFLNVILATRDASAGSSAAQVALAEQNPAQVAAAVSNLSDDDVSAVRGLFRSFGTCSVEEPVTDLARLGLVDRSTAEPAVLAVDQSRF
jgi:hypothetical protein